MAENHTHDHLFIFLEGNPINDKERELFESYGMFFVQEHGAIKVKIGNADNLENMICSIDFAPRSIDAPHLLISHVEPFMRILGDKFRITYMDVIGDAQARVFRISKILKIIRK